MSRFALTEPHPTIPKSGGYIGSGRGGAGNIKKFKPEDLTTGPNATGPASRVPLTRISRPFKRTVPSGRGGAGNMISEPEEPIFQFDEDLVKKRNDSAPVYHIGRGGAGNLFTEAHPKPVSQRKDSTDSTASESERVRMEPNRRGSMLSVFSRRS
ncbi:Hypothetical predicted protein [Lecanosticta acicola]|uniref:Uncharacterized protein n=1 Tax=Lecanosticta acicola TaxID=111012 RepID=A0AAI8YWH4_9PEZI|nr:Hypothetical predicted protein [Lecanosticta acicola]